MQEYVVLVDENDNQIGTEEKIKAHKDGKLHRALSVFIFNSQDQMLLQKRASHKYHSGGLWTNACCSHPRPDENTLDAAHRRLVEEIGFDCPIKEVFSFKYKVNFDNGLTEHEYDHVFFGKYDQDPILNPEEAEDFKWISLDELQEEVKNNPENYTYWFKVSLNKVIENYKKI